MLLGVAVRAWSPRGGHAGVPTRPQCATRVSRRWAKLPGERFCVIPAHARRGARRAGGRPRASRAATLHNGRQRWSHLRRPWTWPLASRVGCSRAKVFGAMFYTVAPHARIGVRLSPSYTDGLLWVDGRATMMSTPRGAPLRAARHRARGARLVAAAGLALRVSSSTRRTDSFSKRR